MAAMEHLQATPIPTPTPDPQFPAPICRIRLQGSGVRPAEPHHHMTEEANQARRKGGGKDKCREGQHSSASPPARSPWVMAPSVPCSAWTIRSPARYRTRFFRNTAPTLKVGAKNSPICDVSLAMVIQRHEVDEFRHCCYLRPQRFHTEEWVQPSAGDVQSTHRTVNRHHIL